MYFIDKAGNKLYLIGDLQEVLPLAQFNGAHRSDTHLHHCFFSKSFRFFFELFWYLSFVSILYHKESSMASRIFVQFTQHLFVSLAHFAFSLVLSPHGFKTPRAALGRPGLV